ncbi:MAG: hypothetical protein HQK96_14445 [Nitrospirae bacterium]|nr:hypothetical protein [Nitrospirota bacterium]
MGEKAKDVVIWVEDMQGTISDARAYIKEIYNFEVFMSSTAFELADLLEEYSNRVLCIILDIMLFSVQDLVDIGIDNSGTSLGHAAGWIIAESFLLKNDGYKNIPILFYSARSLQPEDEKKLEELKKLTTAKIDYIEKTSFDRQNFKYWKEKISDFINAVKKP